MGQQAVVLPPELVLVEPAPDGVLLDVEDELRIARLELDDVRLDDRRDAVATGAHSGAIDLVAIVDERDRAHHAAAVAGVDVELLAEALEGHLEILDDRIAFLLGAERLLARAFDRVLEEVVETSDARRLLLVDERLAAGGHEERLHVALRLGEVEELAAVGLPPHLDDLPRLVEADVGERPGGDLELRVATLDGRVGHPVGQVDDLAEGLGVDGGELGGGLLRGGSGQGGPCGGLGGSGAFGLGGHRRYHRGRRGFPGGPGRPVSYSRRPAGARSRPRGDRRRGTA